MQGNATVRRVESRCQRSWGWDSPLGLGAIDTKFARGCSNATLVASARTALGVFYG
jgi:hypothetical protein